MTLHNQRNLRVRITQRFSPVKGSPVARRLHKDSPSAVDRGGAGPRQRYHTGEARHFPGSEPVDRSRGGGTMPPVLLPPAEDILAFLFYLKRGPALRSAG